LLIPVFQANRVEVVNRQQLDSLLTEHRFQVGASVDPMTAVALGKVLGPSVMIFITASRCSVERNLLSEKQFIGPPVNVSRTQAHFLASMHTVDLATGRELAVQSLETNPRKENRSTNGIAEYPGEVEVQDVAVHEAATKAERLYFPWTETRQVAFMNGKECNLKAAYDLLRVGDNAGALKLSHENVETCKSDPKANHQSDAWYNLGVAYLVADDYDNALQAMAEANKLHSDKAILEAITAIRQQKADTQRAAEIDAKQSSETAADRDKQDRVAQEQANATLTNDTIIDQVKNGFSADLILHEIASQPAKFSVKPNDLLALKKAGVPDSVISAMLDKK
jgi:tetratricopeptide (TPR) repeat protein